LLLKWLHPPARITLHYKNNARAYQCKSVPFGFFTTGNWEYRIRAFQPFNKPPVRQMILLSYSHCTADSSLISIKTTSAVRLGSGLGALLKDAPIVLLLRRSSLAMKV
jgi:hypothetical protein